jgi:hypothetical protein
LIQSANFVNGYLAIASTLHFLSASQYYELATRNAKYSPSFMDALLHFVVQAAKTKGIGAAFLQGILTAHIGHEKGEEK